MRHRVARKLIAEIGELKRKLRGNLRRIGDGVWVGREQTRHFSPRFQMALGILGQELPGGLQREFVMQTGKDVEDFTSRGPDMTYTVSGD